MDWVLMTSTIVLILIITILFIVLMPGLLITIPGNNNWISTMKLETNYWAIGYILGYFSYQSLL